ncbi:MAG TPA: ferredoxin [Amycolatopsis sp.]
MNQPPVPLGPDGQRDLVARVGQALVSATAPGWRRLQVDYRAAGRHVEVDVLVVAPDGRAHPVRPHPEAVRLLGVLRSGMYQPGRGTWLSATLVFDPQRPPAAEFRPDQEPVWRQAPPPIGFRDELQFFPRADRFLPPWLRAKAGLPSNPQPGVAPAAATPPVATTPPGVAHPPAETADDVRTPRVYDGLDEAGRPVVERDPLSPGEREQVLAYLDAAPVVLAARTYETDAFDPSRTDVVPLTFSTDGSWVWPGAVAYYLREHEVAPDPELLSHIRGHRFAVPEVGEPARDLALASITGPPST